MNTTPSSLSGTIRKQKKIFLTMLCLALTVSNIRLFSTTTKSLKLLSAEKQEHQLRYEKQSTTEGKLQEIGNSSTLGNSDTTESTAAKETLDNNVDKEEDASSASSKTSNLNEHNQTAEKEIATPPSYESMSPEWNILHQAGMTKEAIDRLRNEVGFHIVQIGAHVGFEPNDPIANGIIYILDQADTEEQRQKVHWTFVEPSPPNFKVLNENLLKNEKLCKLHSIHAGVVSDSLDDSKKDGLTFYSFRDTIDPETGYDSLSGKTLPTFITQVSSFKMDPLNFNRGVFSRRGLNFNDYVLEVKVPVKSFTELAKEIMGDNDDRGPFSEPFIVLIDTEGYDCEIVDGISPSSPFLPKYLLFETKQCRGKHEASLARLREMGYETWNTRENAVAVMKNEPSKNVTKMF